MIKKEQTPTMLMSLFGGMSLAMIYLIIATSLKSNMFEVLPILTQEPWFNVTIIDFYFNITIISAWVIYKERNRLVALGWITSFVLLGSVTTSLYVFIQLFQLRKGDSLDTLLLRKSS